MVYIQVGLQEPPVRHGTVSYVWVPNPNPGEFAGTDS